MSEVIRRGATGVGLASLVSAGAGYAVLVIAAHALHPADNADFLAFWGLLFFLFGVLGGLQSEVTRSVHVARTGSAERPRGARVLPLGLAVGGALTVVVAVTSPLWAGAVLGPEPRVRVALVCVGVLAFAGHCTVAGTLAGAGRWGAYARLVGAESLVRLGLVLITVLVGGTVLAQRLREGENPVPDAPLSITGIETATAVAAATWLAFWLLRRFRQVRREHADVAARAFLSGAGQAMVGTAASAALVVGFPVLLRVTTPTETYALAAPLLLAVQLTRAPLLIPLNAYQGMAITHFLDERDRGLRPLLRLAAVILAVGTVGAAAAAAVGPWLMEVVLGAGYRVAPVVLAGLTLTAAFLALLTLTGAATLALGGHRAYATGWLLATVCSAVVLLVPGSLEVRVVASLAAGPVLGVIGHGWWLRRATARR